MQLLGSVQIRKQLYYDGLKRLAVKQGQRFSNASGTKHIGWYISPEDSGGLESVPPTPCELIQIQVLTPETTLC